MPVDLFVLDDGNRLVSTEQNTLQLLTPAGWLFSIAGNEDEDKGFEDGQGPAARFYDPCGMTVDSAGHIVVANRDNHALRRVSKAGEVSTLAGNGEEGLEDGKGEAARFFWPEGVALAANDEIVVADTWNHEIRVVTPGCAVRTLAGNREAGFEEGESRRALQPPMGPGAGQGREHSGGRLGQPRGAAGDDGGGGEHVGGQRGCWLCRRGGRGSALQ